MELTLTSSGSGRYSKSDQPHNGFVRHSLGEGGWTEDLLNGIQPCAEAGFFARRHGLVDDARFRRFIKGGAHGAQGGAGILFFPGSEEGNILLLQLMQAGFNAAIVQALARAASHPAFGRFRIRHKVLY